MTAFPTGLTPTQSTSQSGPFALGMRFHVTSPVTLSTVTYLDPSSDFTGRISVLAGNGTTTPTILYQGAYKDFTGTQIETLTTPLSLSPGTNYAVVMDTQSGVYLPYTYESISTAINDGAVVSGSAAQPLYLGVYANDITTWNIDAEGTGTTQNWMGFTLAYTTESGSDTTPPTVPTSLVASSITSSSFNLSWTASTDNVGVVGYQYTLNGGSSFASLVNGGALTNLQADTGYSVQVRALDAAGNMSSWSSALAVTTSPASSGGGGGGGGGSTTNTLYVNTENGWLEISASSSGGGTSTPTPGVFYVEDYGAKGDGSSDDTAAIQAAINAAVSDASAFNYAVTVKFQAKTYVLSSPCTTDSTTTKASAQLFLPPVSSTTQKVILTLEGTSNYASYISWNQPQAAITGTVLLSTVTTVPGSPLGAPAVIAGVGSTWVDNGVSAPYFSNMTFGIRGITVMTTPASSSGPALSGINAEYLAGIDWDNLAVVQNWHPQGGGITPTIPTTQSFGVITPIYLNNARQTIGTMIVAGFHDGVAAGEHLTISDLGTTFCANGISPLRGADHARVIQHFLCESCTVGISDSQIIANDKRTPIFVTAMDCEYVTTIISDSSNQMSGIVNYSQTTGTTSVTGGSNLKLYEFSVWGG